MLLVATAANASVLFDEDFNPGIPGWTAITPRGVYLDGPLRWEYDLVHRALVERSNIYSYNAPYAPTSVAPMLINDAVAEVPFTYTARLTAGDDDGFGLIFGYQNETNFYRIDFAHQAGRSAFPWTGWVVDRKTNGVTHNVFGPSTSFINPLGQPFDVTVSVDALNQLTLQVVEDPEGTATTQLLVDGQPLPMEAQGKVGIFTWGMCSSRPRGFRIENLALSPMGLQGNLYGFTGWTPVIPPNAIGSTALTGGIAEASWFFSANERGPGGTLTEYSDSFAGKDVTNQVDFTGPTLVAGDSAWSNYVVAARIEPYDTQGQGLLLRYQDPSNFYRIVLRQDLGAGIPRGLSIQKNVNQVYTQVYRDSPVKYAPTPRVPYDLVAQISTNQLNVLLVADPDGAARVYTYGPFNVSGSDSGKIGLFSWAMARLEFDWVKVQDGAPLYVSSPFGSPSPARGLNDFAPGQIVEATAGAVSNQPGVRRTATGWIGSGSVPASGTGSNVSFTIGSFSQLHWRWKTEYQFSVTNEPNGTVSFPPGEWWPEGTNLTIVAQPDCGFIFDGWQGDSQSMSPTLNLTMDQPYAIVATFATDSDDDGLSDDWELAYWGDLSKGPEDDPDEDGNRDLEEREDGTDPKLADILRIENVQSASNAPRLAVWNNTGSRYTVEGCTTLTGGWSVVATNQQADLAPISPTAGVNFLRLSQPQKPIAVPPFVPGSWSLVILPDSQFYASTYPDLFQDQTRWIAANTTRFNIQYVFHSGDVVDGDGSTQQWAIASAAFSNLDDVVPYAIVLGNHDYISFFPTRFTLFNSYFPRSKFQSWSTFGGVKDAGHMENSYHLFSAGGVDWLVLALEYGPRNATITWANSIIDQYPDRRVILVTHAYLYDDNTRQDWAAKGPAQYWNPHDNVNMENDPDGTNDGEELWQKLVKLHPNFTFVFNGHVINDGVGRLASTNDAGNLVHQIEANYQARSLGGGAFLRLLEFRPNGRTVQVKTYSPYDGTYKTDSQNQFMLTLQPPLH